MRLTPLGRGLLVAGAISIIAGIAVGAVAVTAVGVFLFALVGCAALVVAEIPRVEVARSAWPPEVERGSPAEIRLNFRSTSTRRQRAMAAIETIVGEQRIATIGPITPQGRERLHYAVSTAKRGVITAGPVLVRRFDPFGLIAADRRFTSTCTVSVRPRQYPLRMLPSGRQRDLEGPTKERSEGTASFHQLREYVPGDDLRRIHWASTARTGDLLVKQMIDTSRPELVVVLDNRETAIGPDDFEHAVDIAASVVRAAEDEDFPTLLLFADGTGHVDPDGHQIPMFDRLTAVQLGPVDSLAHLAEVIAARGRSLVFVTGEPTGTDLVTLARLAAGFAPAYLVSVVADRHAPVVAPRGMRAIACSSAEDFVALWEAQ